MHLKFSNIVNNCPSCIEFSWILKPMKRERMDNTSRLAYGKSGKTHRYLYSQASTCMKLWRTQTTGISIGIPQGSYLSILVPIVGFYTSGFVNVIACVTSDAFTKHRPIDLTNVFFSFLFLYFF